MLGKIISQRQDTLSLFLQRCTIFGRLELILMLLITIRYVDQTDISRTP